MGTSFILCSSSGGAEENPIIIQEKPANTSTHVAVYLSEISFIIADAGDDSVWYRVRTFPDFTGGAQQGIAAPGQTIHIPRRNDLLKENTTYIWWVDVTDGIVWIRNTYSFTTGNENFQGYTLFTPISTNNSSTYLIDHAGTVVHTWPTNYTPCYGVYLVDNGSILRPFLKSMPEVNRGIQKITWNGTVIWEFPFSGENYWQTHDVAPLPNGNVLILALERKTAAESIYAGRNKSFIWDGELWPAYIVEVHPTGPKSGDIVWEWHLWDHLIQDVNSTKENYGIVAEHPELLDINFARDGYKDWIHPNTLHYNPTFDQIIICSRHIGEFWIIDHSTTTEEARNHTGGIYDKGGDFLYRWGNPQTYRAGISIDQKLFGPHDAQWIVPGCPGEGNILIFNNGWNRPGELYSTIDEITPPIDDQGNYTYTSGAAYGPENLTWQYHAQDLRSFYASYISGCERLPNGNTLICNGPPGHLFEVTMDGDTVWSYNNTYPIPGSRVFRVRRYYAPFSPPITPNILGPHIGAVGMRYNYTIVTSDPDGDPVYYSIDWGDNTTVNWLGSYTSGEMITLTHTWVAENTFNITCRAKDQFDSMSNLSTWNVSIGIPYQPNNPSPADEAIDIDIHVNLRWTGGDPDSTDKITYDVYFGTNNPPPKIVSNQTTEVFNPGTLEYNNIYNWRIVAWDNQGMSATSPLWKFTTILDITAPTTTIALNGTLGNYDWFITPVYVTFESDDTESGVNYTLYKIDNDPWNIYNIPVKILTDGDHTLSYYSVDNVGNIETTKVAFLKIDTNPPHTTHTVTGLLGNNSWYISDITIILTATDNTSGINRTYYHIDDENWSIYTTPILITSDDSHNLSYYSVDTAGNTQQIQDQFVFKIDQTTPTINLTLTAQNLLKTKWLLTATVSDETSGIHKVDFYIDDLIQGTVIAPGPYDWYYEGCGTAAYAVVFDNAGNIKTSPHVNSLDISPVSSHELLQLNQFLRTIWQGHSLI